MDVNAGDKVRVKIGKYAGQCGVVKEAYESRLIIQLEISGEVVGIGEAEATNFSLAARKAWARMPHRRVGRPKGTAKTDRVSVTLRIDRELWHRFQKAEVDGLIYDRTATINAWIGQRLNDLFGKE